MIIFLFLISQALEFECEDCLNETLGVGHLYTIILDLDGLRQRRQASLISLLYDEQQFELYEEQLENQIQKNKQQLLRTNLLIEKYYLPSRSCLDTLYDAVLLLDSQFNIKYNDYEMMNGYHYSVDQLQFRSSCYQVLKQFNEMDVELMSLAELEKMELFDEYFDQYYQKDQVITKFADEIKDLDFRDKLEHLSDLFKGEDSKLDEITQQLFLKAKLAYQRMRTALLPELEYAINKHFLQKSKIEQLKDREILLKQQLLYNQEIIQIDSNQHMLLREQIDKQMSVLEMQLEQLLENKDEEVKESMLKLMNATNSDLIKGQEEEEFKKIAMKFNTGRRSEYDL